MEPDTSTSIVEVQPVRPLVSPEKAKADLEVVTMLKTTLLTPDDYQAIQGKNYPKKSAFRKLAVAFGLSDRIITEQRTDREDGSFMWRIVVEAIAPNGRTCTGVGICDFKERKPRQDGGCAWAHAEHDIYSTAHTRAKNRAIADMVAAGMVSAEEMEAVEPGGSEPQSPPAPSKLKPTSPKRGNSEERVFSFKGAGPESGPEPSDPHPF